MMKLLNISFCVVAMAVCASWPSYAAQPDSADLGNGRTSLPQIQRETVFAEKHETLEARFTSTGERYRLPATTSRFQLARLLRQNDYLAFLNLALPIAEGGDIWTMMHIASIYDNGLGIESNADLALQWYTAAAEAGSDEAALIVGTSLARGIFGSVDKQKARHWLYKALESNRKVIRKDAKTVLESL